MSLGILSNRGSAADLPRICRGSAADLPRIRRGSAADPPRICRGSAADPPRICRGSTPIHSILRTLIFQGTLFSIFFKNIHPKFIYFSWIFWLIFFCLILTILEVSGIDILGPKIYKKSWKSVPWKINVLKIEWIWVDPRRIRGRSAADPRLDKIPRLIGIRKTCERCERVPTTLVTLWESLRDTDVLLDWFSKFKSGVDVMFSGLGFCKIAAFQKMNECLDYMIENTVSRPNKLK